MLQNSWTCSQNDGFHTVDLGDQEYVFLYRNVGSYAEKPLIVGTYFQSIDLLSEVYRLKWAVGFCFLISIVSALFAAYIGRQIARPVRRLAEGASRIYQLELASVKRIPKILFRELNNAAGSFNTMLEGLRWFERYVPKSLVKRLIQLHGREGVETMYRDVVILFTDIEHFTTLSEEMPAPLAAEMLSAHFTLVANCVEREGGTIDKYIGDSVMAMWGAPDQYDDAADRACRAAIEIRRNISIDNTQRHAKEAQPIRVRIGINAGRVVVGNIGSPGRINYIVVGDPVNIAQRLEELAKTVGTFKDDVNILLSSNTKDAFTTKYRLEYHGVQEVHGRRGHVEVYGL